MNLAACLLLLAATPTKDGFHRIHPRSVEASSYLESQWNRFDDNYLPIYAVDDDPRTAWVEGVPGLGEGQWLEWLGPHLKKAEVVRIRLRNGYHKSRGLYRANGRAKSVTLQPLVYAGGKYQPEGKAAALRMRDTMGWWELELPVPARFAGFRLALVEVRRGKRYTDTCISDVEVWVKGGDTYRPALERSMFERLQARILERVALAKRRSSGAGPRLRARYAGGEAKTLSAPKRGAWSKLGTIVRVADAAGVLPETHPVRGLIEAADEPVKAGWRHVLLDGDPGLGAQLEAALPVLQSRFVGLYELPGALLRSKVKLQDLDPKVWSVGHHLWTEEIESNLMYEVELEPEKAKRFVGAARVFGFSGRLEDVFVCEKGRCWMDARKSGALEAVGQRRFSTRYDALGGLRAPKALRAHGVHTLGSGRDGSFGGVTRDELVVYDPAGLPVALHLVGRFDSEGDKGPDHAQLFLLEWETEKARPVLTKITEVHIERAVRSWDQIHAKTAPAPPVAASLRRWTGEGS